MASPLSKNLIAGAIGESGAMLGQTLAASLGNRRRRTGSPSRRRSGPSSLTALRALPAQQTSGRHQIQSLPLQADIDGYFLPKSAREIYTAGEQAHVPLLAGWNAEELGAGAVLGREPATPEGLSPRPAYALWRACRRRHESLWRGHRRGGKGRLPPPWPATASSAMAPGNGSELHGKDERQTGLSLPLLRIRARAKAALFTAVEIEYALGNLPLNSRYAWTDDDRKVSATMQAYFANFIKTGNPNGAVCPTGLPSIVERLRT